MLTIRSILRSPWPWALLVAVVALLPWWRNHDHLRDFYDYGLVIAGNARIAAGERPYVDFTTPIQSGIFWANSAAEKLGGGDFLGMTRGAAALIVAAAIGFTLLLARRWPEWLAALAAAAVVLGSASQHTIIWHNTLGVVCLALVAWSTALAPVWRREQWGWHVLTILGLLVGGLNKLNFHLVALAAASGWLVHAWLVRGESLRRIGATAACWVGAGVVLPVVLELAWTGAPLRLWLYNVVGLASGSRAQGLAEVFRRHFYTEPMHDYYGELALPQVGAVGLLMCVVVTVLAWRAAGADGKSARRAQGLALGAGALAFAAGAALLATNFEIAYVGWSAWTVLAIAVLLGSGGEMRGAGCVVFAALLTLLAVFAGESAWRGQRSQFGHAADPREAYVPADTAGPQFSYLRGVKVPPNWIGSLRDIAANLPAADADGLRPVFYGPGLEWLERAFPARKHARLPLWAHWRTSYGDRELAALDRLLGQAIAFDLILTPLAWDYWEETVRQAVEEGYERNYFGPLVVARTPHRVRTLFPDAVRLIEHWGGNTAVTAWGSHAKVPSVHREAGNGILLGRAEGEAVLSFTLPVRRITGEVVVHRLAPADVPVVAEFTIRLPGEAVERWWADVTLAPGESSRTVAYEVDCSGRPFELQVRIPEEHAGRIFGGYRGPRITHAEADRAPPPRLRPGERAAVAVELEEVRRLFPASEAVLEEVVLRGGRVDAGAVELLPGGELWLRFDRLVAELRGVASESEPRDAATAPVLRAGWYKGGRFDLLVQTGLDNAERRVAFQLRTPEPDGWLVFTLDRSAAAAPARIVFDFGPTAGAAP